MDRSDVERTIKGALYRVRVVALEVGERRAALGAAEVEYEAKTKPGGEWTDAASLTEEERTYRNKLCRDAFDMIKEYQKQLKLKDTELIETTARMEGMIALAVVFMTTEVAF